MPFAIHSFSTRETIFCFLKFCGDILYLVNAGVEIRDVRTVVFAYDRKDLDEFLYVIQLNLNKSIIVIGMSNWIMLI